MQNDSFTYYTREISNAVLSLLACANLFKKNNDEEIAALLTLIAAQIDENLGCLKETDFD